MKYSAVLLDATSIQKFIFGSNKLKENIGASYLVANIFKKMSKELNIQPEMDKDGAPLGFIGGGNALLFFKNKEEAKTYLRELTTKLLLEAPGIRLASAVDDFEIENENDDKFRSQITNLFKLLRKNKSEFVPSTIIPKHGITADCERSGFSKESWLESEVNQGFYSSTVTAKIKASQEALHEIEKQYNHILGEDYKFSNEQDNLGRSLGEDSHLAVVHIDGNSIGNKFKECKNLADYKLLSDKVRAATEKSFEELLKYIVNKAEDLENEIQIITEKGKAIIPIRPIILGGDDITFVCDGRLGILFSKIFIEEFEKHTDLDGQNLSACAGVSITKLKYPFYRSYQIAEQLCANAKRAREEESDRGSWIDFHISSGNISGSLDQIRERHYKAPLGNILLRPYKIGQHKLRSLETAEKNLQVLYKMKDGKQIIPNSKIKKLRSILSLDKSAHKLFLDELKASGILLPDIDSYSFSKDLFEGGKTIYFDMIELYDIYPKFRINGRV